MSRSNELASPSVRPAHATAEHVCTKPLLVGMNNPRSLAPEHALFPWPPNCAGHRLFEMLRAVEPSATMTGYRDRFDRVNLVVGPWDAALARRRADEMRPTLVGRSVVLLGKEVAKAFGVVSEIDWMPRHIDDAVYYLLPHPSGRNHRYNVPDCRLAAGKVLARLYLRGMP